MKIGLSTSLIFMLNILFMTTLGGCNSESNTAENQDLESEITNIGDGNGGEATLTPTVVKNVEKIQVLDVNNLVLKNAEIKLLSADTWGNNAVKQPLGADFPDSSVLPSAESFSNVSAIKMNQNQYFEVGSLKAGTYYVQVIVGNESIISAFSIKNSNTNNVMTFNVSLSCSDIDCNDKANKVNAIIGTLSGQIMVQGKPFAKAQVSLSGGDMTNGAFVSGITDANGYFNLPINTINKFATALKSSTLKITAPGYKDQDIEIYVNSAGSIGNQFTMIPDSTIYKTIWSETFDSQSTTRNLWTKADTAENDVQWNLLTNGHQILNTALNKYVYAAPNDQGSGAVIEPLQGNAAYWYGEKSKGNYLGVQDIENSKAFDGGQAIEANYGELISPAIDLSNVTQPISLTFKSWWEIESFNPNQKGFDLMDILVSTDGGSTYHTLVRFNPLSDPQTTLSREAIPFSNTGYNLAPIALQQEPISLDEYVGKKNIRLKFKFKTVDQSHNAFRGWMIDDIKIQQLQGTFPLYEAFLNN
ncbi:carboxypeptidase-like regulatory domain-containing protein [Acinetobacter stercoris]|uniref:Carboxypeptidase regulatory-like domain-containing protein n=1 Tax=Acinetobacter stercoris TaxID=2126983 RepID=A0A2U3N069_9GAMM|nr:carboxypeptidase-like regulatory domain-containing protein [Acinetobacter stercoris]SPL71023.1 hypothetical protein KPC_2201 [Acinetobacter stercoris]